MSNKGITIYAEALKRQKDEQKKPAWNPTRPREVSSDNPRDRSRVTSREVLFETSDEGINQLTIGQSSDLPTREDIQSFSFQLRDELKVKLQAEVPHQWQKDFEKLARDLDVKKLELYRFILGDFLSKVRRTKKGKQTWNE